MELVPSFAWVWFFIVNFYLVAYFSCPGKQIYTFFFPYNYGNLQGEFLVLVFVEPLCVWG
jgi:hypothetical protein